MEEEGDKDARARRRLREKEGKLVWSSTSEVRANERMAGWCESKSDVGQKFSLFQSIAKYLQKSRENPCLSFVSQSSHIKYLSPLPEGVSLHRTNAHSSEAYVIGLRDRFSLQTKPKPRSPPPSSKKGGKKAPTAPWGIGYAVGRQAGKAGRTLSLGFHLLLLLDRLFLTRGSPFSSSSSTSTGAINLLLPVALLVVVVVVALPNVAGKGLQRVKKRSCQKKVEDEGKRP